VSTNEELLNLLKPETWLAWFDENSVEAMVAEHVWDYLDEAEGRNAAGNCFRFLRPGGRLRIAVADALMPDPEYRQLCILGGRDGRKILYDHRRLANVLSQAGFAVQPLEYFDESGHFHQSDWKSSDGHIGRSRRFDPRNKEGKIRFTSLIFDAIKP
jgi:predicted SAM-dependent methyltransferase